MKKNLCIYGIIVMFFLNACREQTPKFTQKVPEEKITGELKDQPFYKALACDKKIKNCSLEWVGDTTAELDIEVYEPLNFVPSFDSLDKVEEVTDQFAFIFEKKNDKWVVYLRLYKLHFNMKGLGNFNVEITPHDNGRGWLCDYPNCHLSYFPWITDTTKVHLGNNKFGNEREAVMNLAPPNALCIYDNVMHKVSEIMKH